MVAFTKVAINQHNGITPVQDNFIKVTPVAKKSDG